MALEDEVVRLGGDTSIVDAVAPRPPVVQRHNAMPCDTVSGASTIARPRRTSSSGGDSSDVRRDPTSPAVSPALLATRSGVESVGFRGRHSPAHKSTVVAEAGDPSAVRLTMTDALTLDPQSGEGRSRRRQPRSSTLSDKATRSLASARLSPATGRPARQGSDKTHVVAYGRWGAGESAECDDDAVDNAVIHDAAVDEADPRWPSDVLTEAARGSSSDMLNERQRRGRSTASNRGSKTVRTPTTHAATTAATSTVSEGDPLADNHTATDTMLLLVSAAAARNAIEDSRDGFDATIADDTGNAQPDELSDGNNATAAEVGGAGCSNLPFLGTTMAHLSAVVTSPSAAEAAVTLRNTDSANAASQFEAPNADVSDEATTQQDAMLQPKRQRVAQKEIALLHDGTRYFGSDQLFVGPSSRAQSSNRRRRASSGGHSVTSSTRSVINAESKDMSPDASVFLPRLQQPQFGFVLPSSATQKYGFSIGSGAPSNTAELEVNISERGEPAAPRPYHDQPALGRKHADDIPPHRASGRGLGLGPLMFSTPVLRTTTHVASASDVSSATVE